MKFSKLPTVVLWPLTFAFWVAVTYAFSLLMKQSWGLYAWIFLSFGYISYGMTRSIQHEGLLDGEEYPSKSESVAVGNLKSTSGYKPAEDLERLKHLLEVERSHSSHWKAVAGIAVTVSLFVIGKFWK